MTVHRTHPPTRAMRETPDLYQLQRQARELLEAYRAQSPDAVIEVAAHHRSATPETFALHDAQFVLARLYGFESWPKLKAAVDGVTTTRLHEAVQKGDLGAARALLARRPEIVDLLRGGPSGFEIRALHIAVMRRDVEMTRLLLEAGADTHGGIWPNRDATSPRTIAEERGYDEIVTIMVAQEEQRGAWSAAQRPSGSRSEDAHTYALTTRDLACCAGGMAFYSTPSDLVRFALATKADSVNGELAGGSVMSLVTRRGSGIAVAVASNVAHANTAALALKVAGVFAEQK